MTKTIILTGGSGFLGTALTRLLLAKGYRVINFDLKQQTDQTITAHPGYSFVRGDITSEASFERLSPLLHCPSPATTAAAAAAAVPKSTAVKPDPAAALSPYKPSQVLSADSLAQAGGGSEGESVSPSANNKGDGPEGGLPLSANSKGDGSEGGASHPSVNSQGDGSEGGKVPPSAVIHLAARQFADAVPRHPSERPAWFAAVNVEGTRNLLAFMRSQGLKHLIYFSTDMTYGLPQSQPVTEDHPQLPLGPYGRTKLAAEQMIRSEPELHATIFRPRLISGPGRLGILTRLFSLIERSLPVPLIGSGHNSYQMVSVEDCARAAWLALQQGCPNESFNLGSDNPPSVRELLEAVIAHAHSRSVLLPLPAAPLKLTLRASDALGLPLLYPEQFLIADANLRLATSRAHESLGWAPTRDDIAGLCAAYDAYLGSSPAQRFHPADFS